MTKALTKAFLAAIALTVLAGCQTQAIKQVEKDVHADMAKAAPLAKKAEKPEVAAKPYTGLVERDDFWIGAKRVKLSYSNESKYPAGFREKFTLGWGDNPVSLPEIAETVTQMQGFPVIIAQDAQTTSTIKINHSDSLASFFDIVTSRLGLSWRYEDSKVIIYKYETRTFRLKALPGAANLTATVSTTASVTGSSSGATGSTGGSSDSSSSSSGSGGSTSTNGSSSNSGSGSQNATMRSAIDIWTEIEKTITSMLSKEGKVVMSPSTSSITVTDTGEVMSRVSKYINERNRSLGKQVVINARVYSVAINDQNQNGIDWNIVYETTKGAISLSTGFAGSAANALAASVLNNSSRFNGSEVVVRALSDQGKVSLVTSASVTTLNSMPVPVQVARQTGYLASVSTTSVANSGTTQALTPGTLTTGFSMNLLPIVYDDGEVLLHYALSISDLAGLTSVGSGGDQIQVPEVNTRNFMQRASLRSGQTLILSGYERESNQWDVNGVHKGVTALGGGYQSEKHKEVIVIMLTPTVSADSE